MIPLNIFLRRITPLLAGLIYLCGAAAYGRETPSNDQISEWRKSAEKGVASAQYSLGQAYDSGNGVPRDAAEAAKWYRKAADQGNAEAQCELAFLYQCGSGLPEDAAEAAKWYRKAAELGNITAQIRLGIRYMGGSGVYAAGVPQDEAEGIKWWKKASDQGSSDAAILLAQRFLDRDYNEGVKWLRVAAERNNPEAMVYLGDCYANGKGLFENPAEAVKAFRNAAKRSGLVPAAPSQEKSPVDFNEAAKWYRKAAEQKDGKALRMLGLCSFYGIGHPKDLGESVKWYRKSADENDYGGQLLLGHCYATGSGVTSDRAEALKCWRNATWPENKILNRFIETWAKEPHEMDAKDETFLGDYYADSKVVIHDSTEAVKWYRKAAEKGFPEAQRKLGSYYFIAGRGVQRDPIEAVKWYKKAAEQGETLAQYLLAMCYSKGDGVPKDPTEAVKWWRRAAELGDKGAQSTLASCYRDGDGVVKDAVEAYKWALIAAVQGEELDKLRLASMEEDLTRDQIAEGQKLARNFKPRKIPEAGKGALGANEVDSTPKVTGTGFFITVDGFLITNNHVVDGSNQIRLATSRGLLAAKVVKVDAVNDLALLKTEGKFATLPVTTSRSVKLGGSVATVGFPNIGLQGFAPKLAKGEIASLSGAADDARYFQISVPVQPGNSGGALVDERGNVVGVVSAKLSAAATLAATGSLPENVNYAVKSSFLLGFLESVPEVASALNEPNTKEEKFETVVKSAEQAAVLVLVY